MAFSLSNSCHGLLCFNKINDDGTAFVLNPLLNQAIALPKLQAYPIFWRSYGIGFDTSANAYKIVCIHHLRSNPFHLHNHSVVTQVFTLGTSSWRAIDSVPRYPLKTCNRYRLCPVFANGVLHWPTQRNLTASAFRFKIVTFDLAREEFGRISCPKRKWSTGRVHLPEFGGYLGVANPWFFSIEIFIMKDYHTRKWIQAYHIKIEPPLHYDLLHLEVLGSWEVNGQVLLRSRCFDYVAYNPSSNTMTTIHIDGRQFDTEIRWYTTGRLVSLSQFQLPEAEQKLE